VAPRKAFARPGGKKVLLVGSSICGSLDGEPADARGLLSGTALGVPLNNWESPLKTLNKPKPNAPRLTTQGMDHATVALTALTAHLKIPSSKLCLARGHTPPLEQAPPRSRANAFLEPAQPRFEGERSPRAGSASVEGPRRPRAGSASLEGVPRTHARPRTRVRAFNALTVAARHHHAPGARTPVLSHQLPRREPIPATAGDCAAWPVPAP
jgi:hypothetical protein